MKCIRSQQPWVAAALLLAACGSPQGLDEDSFPAEYLGATGAVGGSRGGTGSVGTGGSGAVVARGGSGGSGGAGASGSPSGGNGGRANGSGNGGSGPAGTGGTGSAAGNGGTGQTGGACPTDITVLFKRPAAQGGCEGAGCHSPGGIPPDLTSPNPEARLLDKPSSCNGRVYIGADDSFLVEKVTVANPGPGCGRQMPFLEETKLSAADRACITQWADQIGGGG